MDQPAASELELFHDLQRVQRLSLQASFGEPALMAGLTGDGSLRESQRPPDGDWTIWAILAGRGFGKTHAGSEWVHARAAEAGKRIALVGATLDAARAVMVEGESGLLARVPPGQQLTWTPSLRRITWSNGSEARLFSGGEPDSLRGGQFDYAWGDEFAHWERAEATLINLRLATRLWM
ncbi:terminase large subunit domain-containing protein [Sandarakinorhabdus sp.]|uniref:terminase large subunit domain-containing protein n=1 Tax=Sandarakinorhabdus sp. TaxID=1916663 RepID=UPI00286E87BF|nr:terminase family protein [Sandarakinorhabdus sp.]